MKNILIRDGVQRRLELILPPDCDNYLTRVGDTVWRRFDLWSASHPLFSGLYRVLDRVRKDL